MRNRSFVAACFAALLAALAFIAPTPAAAQADASVDILTGRVVGPDNMPRAGVTVAATSVETGITRTKQTGDDGRYTILFPDGGGQYRVEFRAVGFRPVQRNVARQGDEDRLVTDVTLGSQVPVQLSNVTVTARRRPPGNGAERPTPGETGQALNEDQLARLPVDQSDLAAVAALAPGVVPIEGTDTTAASFSVAGQRSTLNNVTLDGLSFGSFNVPAEAVRTTRVITNTYDPSRGQFSGGEIASTTRGGTNEITGGFTYSRRDPTLEFQGSDSSSFSPLYLQDQISAGLGGPIAKNKLFIYGAGQFRRRSDPVSDLLGATPSTLTTLGVQPDSVALFLQGASQLGLPSTTGLPTRRIGDQTTGIVRLDYLLGDANTLTLRGDYRNQTSDPVRIGTFALPSSGGSTSSNGGGVALSLSSAFESGIINELRTYVSHDASHSDPYVFLPSGRVRITSQLANGSQGVQTLSFGGNSGLPQRSINSLFELTDEVSYLSRAQGHRVRLGMLFDRTGYEQTQANNQLGTFTYNTLQDFIANTPASFTRTLAVAPRTGHSLSGALYLADTWQPNRQVQVVYGLRGEATRVEGAPAENPLVQTRFGLNTSDFPSEVHLSPRLGFSLNLTKPDTTDPFSRFRPGFLVRGGIGEFRAKTPTGLFTAAQSATGLAGTESQLDCVGGAVPTPDWSAYGADVASVPTTCADGAISTTPFSLARPSVTAFAPDFEAPRAWRASLGVQHAIAGLVTGSADASWARGVALYGVRDLNLASTPAFMLADEGNRPVYAPAGAIVPSTGAVSLLASREYSDLSQVFELVSGLKSDTRQLTLSLQGTTTRGTSFRLAYTLQRTRDQSSFTCCSAAQGFSSPTTSGNPNVSEWGPGDQDMRHSIQGFFTRPITSTLEITANGRLTSGMPFTPIVGGDINGDGARNDRAFIFDPRTAPDPTVAAGMQALLSNAPQRVRDCLQGQLGEIAGRNSCRGPWTPNLDMQLNWRPQGFGLDGKGTISLIAANVLAGLDQLLHGSNLHGWGQYNRSDPTLLYVRGFDPVAQRYVYDVNGNFGSTNESRAAFRQPFVVALQARLTIGPDPRDRFRRIFAQRNDSASTARVMNPIARILEMKDTLQLTPDQVTRLTVVSDSLGAKTQALSAQIRAIAQKQANSGPQAMMASLRPKIAEGRQALTAALAQAQSILTATQWANVPDEVKNPRVPGMGGGRNGGGRRGEGRP